MAFAGGCASIAGLDSIQESACAPNCGGTDAGGVGDGSGGEHESGDSSDGGTPEAAGADTGVDEASDVGAADASDGAEPDAADAIADSADAVADATDAAPAADAVADGGGDATGCTGGPPAPVSSADSGAGPTSFTANWVASSGATTYDLDVSTSSSFSSFVLGNQNVGNVTSYAVTGLACGTTYYYRVRAGDGCGASGNSGTITAATTACSTAPCTKTITTSLSQANPFSAAVIISYSMVGGGGGGGEDLSSTAGAPGSQASGSFTLGPGLTPYVFVSG